MHYAISRFAFRYQDYKYHAKGSEVTIIFKVHGKKSFLRRSASSNFNLGLTAWNTAACKLWQISNLDVTMGWEDFLVILF